MKCLKSLDKELQRENGSNQNVESLRFFLNIKETKFQLNVRNFDCKLKNVLVLLKRCFLFFQTQNKDDFNNG